MAIELAGANAIAQIALKQFDSPILERSLVQAQIARLQGRYEETAGNKERGEIRQESVALSASLRFVLNWETDANDVDLHVVDGAGEHAYFGNPLLASGATLSHDNTNGYGPERFAASMKAGQFPYSLKVHYFSRGPMGYGMGQVEILQHDGEGEVRTESRPFVVMNDEASAFLGRLTGPLE